jgi:hypothetical protein
MTNGLLDTKQANSHTGVNNTLSTNSKNTDLGLLGQITDCKKFDSETNVGSDIIYHTNKGLLDVKIK